MKEIVLDRINQAYKGELGKRIQEDAFNGFVAM